MKTYECLTGIFNDENEENFNNLRIIVLCPGIATELHECRAWTFLIRHYPGFTFDQTSYEITTSLVKEISFPIGDLKEYINIINPENHFTKLLVERIEEETYLSLIPVKSLNEKIWLEHINSWRKKIECNQNQV